MKSNLYALLVGIDNYPDQVPQLKGCINDVKRIESVISISFTLLNPQIEKLTNEQATKSNIIKSFRTHLSKAGENDTVLFYYSGHGSRENSPEAFWAEFPERKNETLVCYDSRLPGGYDLADKEIALLLAELGIKNSQIVVCLDCCHSGSGTRNSIDLGAVRQAENFTSSRALDTYLDGFYSNQIQKTGKIIVPETKHVILSACQNDEKAFETQENYGLFTSILAESLDNLAKTGISYADLFKRINLKANILQKNQHPKFEFFGGFNPHDSFLTGLVADKIRTLPIYFDYTIKKWKVSKGQIHGLTKESFDVIKFWVFMSNSRSFEQRFKIAEATVSEVLLEESVLNLNGNVSYDQVYLGYQLNETSKNISLYFSDQLSGISGSFEYEKISDKNNADYWLLNENKHYQIIHRLSEKLIAQSDNIQQIDLALQKIARWENLKKLKNSESRIFRDGIQIEFELENFKTVAPELDLTLLEDENANTEKKKYNLTIKNGSGQDLHFKVLFISPLYGIHQLSDTIIPNGSSGKVLQDKTLGFFNSQLKDRESNCLFKVIASKKNIDLSFYEQDNFSLNIGFPTEQESVRTGGRFLDETETTNLQSNDWTCLDFKLRLLKSKTEINESKQVSLANDQIIISAHKNVRAKVSVSNFYNASRGSESDSEVALSSAAFHGLNILGLSALSRGSDAVPELIELKEIEGDVSPDDPLIIQLNATETAEDEILLPVAIDGDNLVVIGTGENGKSKVYIEHIPENKDVNTRNLGRALKFCLMKLVLKSKPDKYFQLRWVDFEKPVPERIDTDLNLKVSRAKNILLVVHGIIGDTEGMFPFLAPLVNNNSTDDRPFDLTLTFDYECLNTPIDKIAENLMIELAGLGIHNLSDKRVSIIAHSMGGLVSRVLIEKYKVNFVEKLIMAGTPNGGSNFGKIPSYISLATNVLSLGMSSAIFAPHLAWAAGLIAVLKRSDKILVTLAEMNQKSDFIQNLYKMEDPHIPYYILAGRIDWYEDKTSTGLGKLANKLTLMAGNLFQKGLQHDIAVYTSDIQKVATERSPKAVKKEIGCTHMIYYQEEDSTEIMRSWLTEIPDNEPKN